jgi:outer membrane protein
MTGLHRHRLVGAVAAGALLACATPAGAQQVAGALSLDDALRLARSHNPGFQRARNDLDVAWHGVRAAWASAFLPSLGTTVGFSGSRRTAMTGEDVFGHPVRLPESRTATGSSASQGVSTQMTLFDGFAGVRRLQAQRALFASTAAQIDAQEIQLVAQVSRDYYQALKTASLIRLETDLLASAHDRMQRTEELMRIAARNRVDVLGAHADVAQVEQNLDRARGEADKARLTLATTLGIEPATTLGVEPTTSLGIEPTTSLTLDTVLPAVFDPADLEPDALVARALAGSPVVRQRQAAVEAARHRSSAVRARRLPTLSGSAGYSRSVNQQGYGAIGELSPLNYGFSFGITASLPLFNRFQTSVAVAEASAAVEDAGHDLRAARLAAERDVRAALIDLANAYRSLRLAEQNAELSRERQELTQEQYRLGGVNFTELQNVIDRTAQAERQALDARFHFVLARLNLEEKLGARLEG